MSTISASPSTTSSTSSPESPSDAPNNAEDSDIWTRHQENLFEKGLNMHSQRDTMSDGKLLQVWFQVKMHGRLRDTMELSVEDVKNIDLGIINLPAYPRSVENISKISRK